MAGLTLNPNLAAMHCHEGFGDGQAQTRPCYLLHEGAIGPVETIEDFFLILRSDADARICHAHLQKVASDLSGDSDLTTGWSVMAGVVN